MNTVLIEYLGVVITPWKLVGYLGVALFAGRWFIQLYASRRKGRPDVAAHLLVHERRGKPACCSAISSSGKNDSVGILSNLFPLFMALYNLRLDFSSNHEHSGRS